MKHKVNIEYTFKAMLLIEAESEEEALSIADKDFSTVILPAKRLHKEKLSHDLKMDWLETATYKIFARMTQINKLKDQIKVLKSRLDITSK